MTPEPSRRIPPWLAAAARRRPLIGLVVILLVLAVAYAVAGTDGPAQGLGTTGTTTSAGSTAGGTVEESALPAQAQETLALIRAGGPFPYEQDGSTFGNRERLLPAQPTGFYREYTVPTPGEDDRGPRRIVTGDDAVSYYTEDHYDSFRRIVEGP